MRSIQNVYEKTRLNRKHPVLSQVPLRPKLKRAHSSRFHRMAEVEEKCEINGEKDDDIIEEVGETQTQKKKKKKKKKKKTG